MTDGNELVSAFLLVLAGLFPIVNPLGSAPIFFNLTRSYTDAERQTVARQVAVNSFALLLGSMFLGAYVLEFFGISLPVVRIAGGLVVSVMGWKLLTSEEAHQGRADTTTVSGARASSDAFYPLTMPLTVGPGSISVAITIGSHRPERPDNFARLAMVAGASVAGLCAIAAVVYVSYRFAPAIARFLGDTGVNVVVRLSAFILMCIGIEIVWSGYSDLASSLAASLPH
jgi:multiple antibiotic resistance protein